MQKVKYPIDPLSLTVDGVKSPVKLTLLDSFLPTWSPEIKKYTGQFIMTQANFCAIRRSDSVLQYAKQFTFSERLVFDGYFSALNMQMSLLGFRVCLFFSPTRWLLRKIFFPATGSGPSKEIMDKGFLKVTGFAQGTQGSKVKSVLYFGTDPGYRDTARMLAETGLALVEGHGLAVGGGVYMPACLGSSMLLRRLVNTGCYWKLEKSWSK